MEIFNIDEVIHHITTVCTYPQLILLSQINNQFNKIFTNVIGHYDHIQLLKELNISMLCGDKLTFTFKLNNLSTKFNNFEYKSFLSRDNYTVWHRDKTTCVYGKNIYISHIPYTIFTDGSCKMIRNDVSIFINDYKLLLVTLKYM